MCSGMRSVAATRRHQGVARSSIRSRSASAMLVLLLHLDQAGLLIDAQDVAEPGFGGRRPARDKGSADLAHGVAEGGSAVAAGRHPPAERPLVNRGRTG